MPGDKLDSHGEKRDGALRFRVSPKEQAELQQAAEADGQDFSDWARTVLLRTAKEQGEGRE